MPFTATIARTTTRVHPRSKITRVETLKGRKAMNGPFDDNVWQLKRTYGTPFQCLSPWSQRPKSCSAHARTVHPNRELPRTEYVSALVRIHNRCGFDDEEEDRCLQCGHSCGHTNRLRERRIRDRLIFGLRDSSMQRRVLLEDFGKNLTLDRVLQVCKAHESSTDTGHALSQDPSAHLLAARQSSYKRQAHASRPQRTTTETSPCYYCGDGSHPRSQCPAWRQFCQQCGKQGHLAVVCRQKAPQSVQQATLGHLYLHQTEKAGDHLISILVTLHNDCQHEIRWLPDSGADVDALSAHKSA